MSLNMPIWVAHKNSRDTDLGTVALVRLFSQRAVRYIYVQM